MNTEELIQKLQSLDLDPLLLGSLIEKIRQEGLTDKLKTQAVALIQESMTVNLLQRDALLQAKLIVEEDQAASMALEDNTSRQIDQITKETEDEIGTILKSVPSTPSSMPSPIMPTMPSAPPLPPLPVAPFVPSPAPQPFNPAPVAPMAPVSAPVMPPVAPTPSVVPVAEQGDDDWLSLLQKDEESSAAQPATPAATPEPTPPVAPVVPPSV